MIRSSKVGAVLALALAGTLGGGSVANAIPRPFPTKQKELFEKQQALAAGVDFAQPPCPENGIINGAASAVSGAVGANGVGVGNCGVVQPPATGFPWPGQMAYAGGRVQVHQREYVVFWGWGDKGAFPGRYCVPVKVTEPLADGSSTSFTLPCDPDGAGKLMADFVAQIGGTQWMGSQTQYYQTDAAGKKTYIANEKHVLAGVWVDQGNLGKGDDPNLKHTDAGNPTGLTNTNTALAAEATRAAKHFGVPADANVINDNFIIVQPAGFSDPNAEALGYCAFHDYTESDAAGNSYYKDDHVQQGVLGKSFGLAYTNMPYVLNQGSGCGAESVNAKTDGGDLDGFTIALGHEIEETSTDPGGEATVGNVTTLNQDNSVNGGATFLGAWYDATDPNENGDKCAYVGNQTSGFTPIPGQTGNIIGNDHGRFAVQSLWSNSAAQGAGYCAGVASSDLPTSVGDGEQPAPAGGTNFTDTKPAVAQPPVVTCNGAHLIQDDTKDGRSLLTPNPSNALAGGQNDSLDVTTTDLSYSGGSLTLTMTIRDLATTTPNPGEAYNWAASWVMGGTQYGISVLLDGQGQFTATDGKGPLFTDKTLPAGAVKITPGANGTIAVTFPGSDVGGATKSSQLSYPGVQTSQGADASAAGFGALGFYADQDTNESTYTVGAPACPEQTLDSPDGPADGSDAPGAKGAPSGSNDSATGSSSQAASAPRATSNHSETTQTSAKRTPATAKTKATAKVKKHAKAKAHKKLRTKRAARRIRARRA